jgi:hypothetical protein
MLVTLMLTCLVSFGRHEYSFIELKE